MNSSNIDLLKLIKDQSLPDCKLDPPQRIILAALKLFVEQGYFNTNVPDLSKESNCSVGSIYHHFQNKEEVAAALYNSGITSFRSSLESTIDNHTDPETILKQVVIFFLNFTAENPELSKYLWLSRHNEFMSGEIAPPTIIGFDQLGRTLTKTIKSGIRQGKIRNLKAHIIWSVLFGVPLSYARDWLDGYNRISPDKVAEQLAEACWRSLSSEVA